MRKLAIVYKILVINIVFSCLFLAVNNCCAAEPLPGVTEEAIKQEEAFVNEAGFDMAISIGDVVGAAVSAFLGFLGIIFLVLMVIGGYKYMMARGNEEQVTEALGLMRRAIIGLIITAGAYSITYFIFNAIDWVGGGGGSGINATSDF